MASRLLGSLKARGQVIWPFNQHPSIPLRNGSNFAVAIATPRRLLQHGYSVGKLPMKFASNLCEAAFGSNGVIEWIAGLYV
jgi:hypothetical protein